MTKKILIEDIKIDRELRNGDDLSDLSEDTVHQPIVVQGDRLIDGLRRVELAKKLGITELEAHDPQTLEEACDVLALQHSRPITDWLRLYELTKYLRTHLAERTKRVRTSNTRQLRASRLAGEPKPPSVVHSRILFGKALGGTPSSQFISVVPLFEQAPRELVLEVLSGKVTPHGAMSRSRRREFRGQVTGKEGQLVLLNTAVQNLRNLADSLWMLGSPIEVDPQTVTQIISELRKSRTDITKALKRLEEAIQQ
jgi:hypothetical protein